MNGIKANARMRLEQDVDLVWKNMKPNLLGQSHDEVVITTESRYKHYKANENHINLKDGPLSRNYFGETGSVKNHQNLIPKQLVNQVLRGLCEGFGKHPGIAKNNNYLQRKRLFLKNGAISQGLGHVIRALYRRITN